MKRLIILLNIIFSLVAVLTAPAFSQAELDIETGVVSSGYNDVRIPGDRGTLFSLSEDLKADPGIFYRIRLFYHFNEKHHLGVLYAPLSIKSAGQVNRDIFFEGEMFPANTPLETTFKFNSYRVIYRYDFLRKEKLEMGIGLTGKIRDAKIAVEGNDLKSEKKNMGFVPLIHFRLLWKFAKSYSFLLDADALAAPQGRAEDVFVAIIYRLSPKIDLKAGYRIVEGGAENDKVYTFALINYTAVGAVFYF